MRETAARAAGTVTLAALYPPIAAATVLNVILFAFAWRAHQVERREGDAPWYLTAGLLAYMAALGGFLYLTLGRPLRGGFDYFAAAALGEAMGVVVVYAGLNALVFSRGRPWRERALLFALTAVLGFATFGAVLS